MFKMTNIANVEHIQILKKRYEFCNKLCLSPIYVKIQENIEFRIFALLHRSKIKKTFAYLINFIDSDLFEMLCINLPIHEFRNNILGKMCEKFSVL